MCEEAHNKLKIFYDCILSAIYPYLYLELQTHINRVMKMAHGLKSWLFYSPIGMKLSYLSD